MPDEGQDCFAAFKNGPDLAQSFLAPSQQRDSFFLLLKLKAGKITRAQISKLQICYLRQFKASRSILSMNIFDEFAFFSIFETGQFTYYWRNLRTRKGDMSKITFRS